MEISSIQECLEMHPKTGLVVGINFNAIAHWIISLMPVATVVETKEVLVYHNGKYVNNGAELVHRLLVEGLSHFIKDNGQTVYSKHLYDEVLSIVRGLTYVHIHRFDADLDIINCQNGLLNWRTMTLEPHRHTYYSRIQIPVDYDPDAECPNILGMYNTILREEDKRKAYEFIAYCLYRKYPIQKVFILLGPGSTGKSHFIDSVVNLLGAENVSSISMHDLEKDRFATSDLYNKLANTFGDMEQTELPNVNILKMLTSNKDVIRAQKKNEHAFNFVNFAKFLFATNRLPRVRDDTSGFYRRVEILAFEHVFEQDEYDATLINKISTPLELSGLLNMVLVYLDQLIERNEFSNSFDASKAEDKYKIQSDPVRMFIETYVEEVADSYVSKDAVYREYVRFCEKNNLKPLHPVWFGRTFRGLVPWNHYSIRDFDGVKKTAWLNTALRFVE